MKSIKEFIKENSTLLFKPHSLNNKLAVFDEKGFFLSKETQSAYDLIKNEPHIYVAWCANSKGFYYVGKSFQKGGRWKRQHAYHLGTLAYHLIGKIRYDDQNHSHWIENWMHPETLNVFDDKTYSIELKEHVHICFIPFDFYSKIFLSTSLGNPDIMETSNLDKKDIKKINTDFEKLLIDSYLNDNLILLNVQNNKKNKKINHAKNK